MGRLIVVWSHSEVRFSNFKATWVAQARMHTHNLNMRGSSIGENQAACSTKACSNRLWFLVSYLPFSNLRYASRFRRCMWLLLPTSNPLDVLLFFSAWFFRRCSGGMLLSCILDFGRVAHFACFYLQPANTATCCLFSRCCILAMSTCGAPYGGNHGYQ